MFIRCIGAVAQPGSLWSSAGLNWIGVGWKSSKESWYGIQTVRNCAELLLAYGNRIVDKRVIAEIVGQSMKLLSLSLCMSLVRKKRRSL